MKRVLESSFDYNIKEVFKSIAIKLKSIDDKQIKDFLRGLGYIAAP
jgi:hypothetical protein